MTSEPITGQPAWPEALATVTACTYDAGAGRALAFGLPTTKHFRIAYNYFADDEIHTGQFNSAKPIPQGTLFPIHYNPEAPHHNSHDASSSPQTSRTPLLLFGIAGSLVLSLAWLAILRGCH
jgi:hypothetical protein